MSDDTPSVRPSSVSIRSRYRDLNSRKNGTEAYRLALVGTRLVWADQHPEALVVSDTYPRCSASDAWRADDRRGATRVELPAGTVIVEIEHSVRGGRKSAPSYTAGRLTDDRKNPVDWDAVRHVGSRKTATGYVHVLVIDGERVEVSS